MWFWKEIKKVHYFYQAGMSTNALFSDRFFVFITCMAKIYNSEPLDSTLFRLNKNHMKFEFDKLDCIGFPRMVWAHN